MFIFIYIQNFNELDCLKKDEIQMKNNLLKVKLFLKTFKIFKNIKYCYKLTKICKLFK